jgi:DNA-binding winged helix-turn-helix (wHTH) protein
MHRGCRTVKNSKNWWLKGVKRAGFLCLLTPPEAVRSNFCAVHRKNHHRRIRIMGTDLSVEDVVFKFGGFELFPERRLLSRSGRTVKMGSRALDLLVALVERAGRVVTKDELISRVWPDVIVEDTNLRVNICNLRRVLGDDGLDDRYIVYVARRGYVFVALLESSRRAAALLDRPVAHLAHSTAGDRVLALDATGG